MNTSDCSGPVGGLVGHSKVQRHPLSEDFSQRWHGFVFLDNVQLTVSCIASIATNVPLTANTCMLHPDACSLRGTLPCFADGVDRHLDDMM